MQRDGSLPHSLGSVTFGNPAPSGDNAPEVHRKAVAPRSRQGPALHTRPGGGYHLGSCLCPITHTQVCHQGPSVTAKPFPQCLSSPLAHTTGNPGLSYALSSGWRSPARGPDHVDSARATNGMKGTSRIRKLSPHPTHQRRGVPEGNTV